ncbi:hypothetical protein PIB30_045745 [Stylosanthes scabra]|uniref:Transposase MuDR plant domain-containing protein n=1 Tax=Stylosanthes scabra TaxID=79078 RepID=A0ABU6QGT7_9FABA|nr:hypothetical protein [Stylosanthes scabra]
MLDLNRKPEGNSEGFIPFSNQLVADVVDSHDESMVEDPTTHPYLLNHDSDNDDIDNEPVVFPHEKEEDEEKKNNNNSKGTRNIGAMNQGSYELQEGLDDIPIDEFEVGQKYADKEAVMLAVKTYSIRRSVEYKILESNRLKYVVQCAQFGPVCQWSIHISYRRKQEIWKIRR